MHLPQWIRGLFRPSGLRRSTPRNDVPRILKLGRPGERLSLGGRTFHAVPAGRGPLVQDLELLRHLERAGLDRLALDPGETAPAYAERLLHTLIASPHVLALLGCLITPEGVAPEDWTPKTGQETADFLGRLSDEEDKAEVRRLLVSVLIPFLERASASWLASRSGSEAAAAEAAAAG